MKTLKLDQFAEFECKASQMDIVRGGEMVYTGRGTDGTCEHGGSADEYIVGGVRVFVQDCRDRDLV